MSVGKHPRRPLRSSGPIERGTPMKRGGRITPKKRKPSEHQRIYGGLSRIQWVKSLDCTVRNPEKPWVCRGPIENAHTENGGMGRKGDADTIIPLCKEHHAFLHQWGAPNFARVFSVDLAACAARIATAWEAYCDADS